MSHTPSSPIHGRARGSRARFASTLGMALALSAATARADEPDAVEQAKALFIAGLELVDQGQADAACQKFTAAVGLYRESAAARYQAGLCHERAGRLAAAARHFEAALELARASDKQQLASDIEAHLGPLAERVPRLQIDVSRAVEGLRVERRMTSPERLPDDPYESEKGRDAEIRAHLSPRDFGTEVRVEVGEHRIEATAPGFEPFATTVTLKPGEPTHVLIPELVAVSAPPPPPPPAPEPSEVVPDPAATDAPSPLPLAGYALLGVGGAGLVTGAILGGLALKEKAAADGGCPDKTCTPEGFDHVERGRGLGIGATIGLTLGGALAATGVVLAWTGASEREVSFTLAPMVGLDAQGALLSGAF